MFNFFNDELFYVLISVVVFVLYFINQPLAWLVFILWGIYMIIKYSLKAFFPPYRLYDLEQKAKEYYASANNSLKLINNEMNDGKTLFFEHQIKEVKELEKKLHEMEFAYTKLKAKYRNDSYKKRIALASDWSKYAWSTQRRFIDYSMGYYPPEKDEDFEKDMKKRREVAIEAIEIEKTFKQLSKH